jgi:hypothetical protein
MGATCSRPIGVLSSVHPVAIVPLPENASDFPVKKEDEASGTDVVNDVSIEKKVAPSGAGVVNDGSVEKKEEPSETDVVEMAGNEGSEGTDVSYNMPPPKLKR